MRNGNPPLESTTAMQNTATETNKQIVPNNECVEPDFAGWSCDYSAFKDRGSREFPFKDESPRFAAFPLQRRNSRDAPLQYWCWDTFRETARKLCREPPAWLRGKIL